MAVIVATRYRARLKALPAFMQHLRDHAVRLQSTPGFTGGKLRVELRQVFWLVEVWSSEPVLPSPDFGSSLKLVEVTTWSLPEVVVPSWREVGAQVEGRRPSRLIGLPIKLLGPISTEPMPADGSEPAS